MVMMPPAARVCGQSPFSAMAASVFRGCSSTMAICRRRLSDTEAIQLEDVVRRAYQRPLTLDVLKSPQQELPEAPRLLNLSDHGFDDRLARRVDSRSSLRVELPRSW